MYAPPREIEATVHESIAYLEALAGPVRYFAAPYGEYSNDTLPSLKLFQFELSMSTEAGFLGATSDTFRVPRLGIDRDCPPAKFACITSGLMLWLRRYKYLFVVVVCMLGILAGVALI